MFVTVRFDSERTIVPLGASDNKKTAQDIMAEDFKQWFEEKYNHEMKERNLTFDEMFKEVNESDECDFLEDSAYLNECNHVDFDWSIIDTDNID